ncbi:unnamed protein product [Diamesa serratosioi]
MALPNPFFNQKEIKNVQEPKAHVNKPRNNFHDRNQHGNKKNYNNNQNNNQNNDGQNQSWVAWCKYCREGFASDTELYQHRGGHVKCTFEGCKFNASVQVVDEHFQKVHNKTNPIVKIKDFSTPEDIEKWRQERRKRYPTAANMQLRQQSQEERFSRGEKLEDKKSRFGDKKERNQNRNKPPKDQNRVKKQKPKKSQHPAKINEQVPEVKKVVMPGITKKEVELSSDDEGYIKMPKFGGTSLMKNYHTVEEVIKEKSALTVLGMYGSDSDSNCESDNEGKLEDVIMEQEKIVELPELKETVIEEAPAMDIEEQPEVEENSPHTDNEAPDEAPIVHQQEEVANVQKPNDNNHLKRKREPFNKNNKPKPSSSVLNYSKLRKTCGNPFLEKLLQEDMRHERNVLLQCVSYVVKNSFFGVGQAAKDEVKDTENNLKKEDV